MWLPLLVSKLLQDGQWNIDNVNNKQPSHGSDCPIPISL